MTHSALTSPHDRSMAGLPAVDRNAFDKALNVDPLAHRVDQHNSQRTFRWPFSTRHLCCGRVMGGVRLRRFSRRSLLVIIVVCLSIGLVPKSVLAQTPKSLGGLFGNMQSQLTELAIRFIDDYLAYLGKPETAEKFAVFQKNYYDALIAQGFTKDQAFQLIRHFGNPLAHGLTSGN